MLRTLNDSKDSQNLNDEFPDDIGTWTLQQGINLNDIEKKATDSLRRKQKVHETLIKRIQTFRDSTNHRSLFIILMFVFSVSMVLSVLEGLGLIRYSFILKIIDVIFIIGPYVYLVIRISKFVWKNKGLDNELEETDKENGIGTDGKATPDTIEIITQTFVPRLKNFMEAVGNHSTQEHIKQMIHGSMISYEIYSEKVGFSLQNSKKIMYSEAASLEYLINNISKASGIKEDIVKLAYYDYIKDPVVKDTLKNILRRKESKISREKLIQLLKKSIPVNGSFPWRTDSMDKIVLETLEQYVSNGKEYTIRSVKAQLSELFKRAESNFNKFITNLDTFRVKVDLEKFKMYSDKDLTLEYLEDGTFFINTLFSKWAVEKGNLNIVILNLIYHYGDPESDRRTLLMKLGKDDKELFASFVYKDVLGKTNSIKKEMLGKVLSSIGDYKIEKLGSKFNNILELLDFLNNAEKAMKFLNFTVSINVKTDEFVKQITTSVISENENQWMKYYLEYFFKLVDWKNELVKKFPESHGYSIEKYAKILFILFCNGKLSFQPAVDRISLNKFYLSYEHNGEKTLLKFTEMFQKSDINNIPKIIMEILEHPDKDKDQYFVNQFRSEFERGNIPTYDFLVSNASMISLKQSIEIPLKDDRKNGNKILKKIVDTIFDRELNDEFIKSMLIGGALNAYLIFKPSKKGSLITTLKSGSTLPNSRHYMKSFASYLKYNWTALTTTEFRGKTEPTDFYRVDDSGFAVILGIVPEGITFNDFSITMDSFIRKYLADLIKYAHSFEDSPKKTKDAISKIKSIEGWQILPLDISAIRKLFDSENANSAERGYVRMMKNLLKDEKTEKKLAWIGLIESKGDVSEDYNLRSIIRNIANHDFMGFARYLEFDKTYLEPINGATTADLSTIILERGKEKLNNKILELSNTNSFFDACLKIVSGTIKKEFLKSELEQFIIETENVKLKFSSDGIESIEKEIPAISEAFVFLVGKQEIE